jgi:hypothetical protein
LNRGKIQTWSNIDRRQQLSGFKRLNKKPLRSTDSARLGCGASRG